MTFSKNRTCFHSKLGAAVKMIDIKCELKKYVVDQILFATWLKLRLNANYWHVLLPAIPPTFTGGYVLLSVAFPTSLMITFPIFDTSLVNSWTKSWICFARSRRSKVDCVGNDIKTWNSLFQSRLFSLACGAGTALAGIPLRTRTVQ